MKPCPSSAVRLGLENGSSAHGCRSAERVSKLGRIEKVKFVPYTTGASDLCARLVPESLPKISHCQTALRLYDKQGIVRPEFWGGNPIGNDVISLLRIAQIAVALFLQS